MKKRPGDSVTCAVGRIPERKRVQAPFGARVLSVMCWRTDRRVPPAERAGSEGWEKVLKIDGAFAPRVLV